MLHTKGLTDWLVYVFFFVIAGLTLNSGIAHIMKKHVHSGFEHVFLVQNMDSNEQCATHYHLPPGKQLLVEFPTESQQFTGVF